MLHVLISVAAFIVAIGILVVFHEFGHFWVARKLGVKVLRFSIGLGKPIWKKVTSSGLEIVVAAVPLGGYVKMLDSNDETIPESEHKYAFDKQPVSKRFAIVLAGPVFNFIFAILAYWLIYAVGVEQRIPLVGKIAPDSIAAKAGLSEGLEITHINDIKTPTWPAIVREVVPYIGDQSSFTMQTLNADGKSQSHRFDLAGWKIEPRRDTLFESLGMKQFAVPLEPVIGEVLDNEPAQIAGFKDNDRVIKVNNEDIDDWNRFVEIIHESALKPITVVVLRGNEQITLTVTPRVRSYINEPDKGYLGIVADIPDDHGKEYLRLHRFGMVESFSMALVKTWEYTKLTYIILGKMVTGHIALDNLSGPITIAQGAGASASSGFVYFVGFLAIISISLAVLNLLPIPILDGGHLLYYIIEMITKKPVPAKIQLAGYKMGLFVIIFLMSVALFNDIIRMF